MKESLRLTGLAFLLFLFTLLQSIREIDIELRARLGTAAETGATAIRSITGTGSAASTDQASLALGFYYSKSAHMENVSSILKKQVDKHQTPSVQYLFFNTDSIVYEFHYGLQDIKAQKPVDETTAYHLYSVTKTFTALAVLQLAQAGRLKLDDPVAAYLPQFPYSQEVTVEQLLSHTAGIPNPLPLRWIHLSTEHPAFDRDEFFSRIFREHPKMTSEPGARFKYSNPGYVLLGQLIEQVSGMSFEEYVTEHILKPCNIDPGSLAFEIDPGRHATGYHKWWSFSNAILGLMIDKKKFMGPREGKWKPFHPFYNNSTAYGGLFGSGKGLVAYGQNLLKKDGMLLNEQYRSTLFQERSVNGRPTGMSLSWFTGSLNGQAYVAHAGGGGGYYVELRLYPGSGVGSTILYNRSGMTDQRMLDRIDPYFLQINSGKFS